MHPNNSNQQLSITMYIADEDPNTSLLIRKITMQRRCYYFQVYTQYQIEVDSSVNIYELNFLNLMKLNLTKLKLTNLTKLQDSIGGTLVASCEGCCSLRGSCTGEGAAEEAP